MRNIAGKPIHDNDREITEELMRCGVDWYRDHVRQHSEVKTSVYGFLGKPPDCIKLERAWRYWVVSCWVPLVVADELYNSPVGRTDIRVTGYAGNQLPKDGAIWINKETNKQIVRSSEREQCARLVESHGADDIAKMAQAVIDDPAAASGNNGFISSYHIDSELGLYIFARTVTAHGCTTAVPAHLKR